MIANRLYIFIVFTLLIAVTTVLVVAQDDDEVNEFGMTGEEMIERGEYLAHISGCVACHSPLSEDYMTEELTLEQLQTIGLAYEDAQDIEDGLLSGGREFPLGPAGVLVSPNLTPHETGLGDWTDEEIEAALRIGVNKDGRRLHPLMPYLNYFGWPESDMQAMIQYLKSIPAVENEVVQTGPSGEGLAPELTISEELPQMPPDGSDPIELGAYLVQNVMSCSDCHTPLDPDTGAPMMEMQFAGGQAYGGPWGTVYGGNITPHDETGLGEWTAEDYERVLREGVRIDGRRLVLMPWQDYAAATDEDMDAVVAYLQSLEPIENEVPAPALEEIFEVYVEDEEE